MSPTANSHTVSPHCAGANVHEDVHEDEDEEAVMHSDVDARAAAWLRESPFRGAQAAADAATAAVRVAAKAADGAVGPSFYPA